MNRQRNQQAIARARTPRLLQAVQIHPFFFRLGPVALSICSVLMISLMAILYLSQLGQAVTVNQQLQDLRNQQAALVRQNNDLINTIASEQSPAYIAAQARAHGLVPVSPQNVQVIVLPNIQAQQNGSGSGYP
jgi:cell division protein FtsL